MQPQRAGSAPLAVPRPVTGAIYFSCVAAAVLLRLAVKRYKLFPTVLALSLGLQIAVLVGVPLFVLGMRWRNRKLEERVFQRESAQRRILYLPSWTTVSGFSALGGAVWFAQAHLTELQIWRVAAAFEGLAFGLLALRAATARNFAGLSARKLALDGLRLACRVAAVAAMGRKLPRRSADPFVQAVDVGCLLAVVLALYCAYARASLRSSLQADADNFYAVGLVIGAAVLGTLLRADIAGSFPKDALWTTALCLDAVAMLPQLWMVAQLGGVMDGAVGHHVAAIFANRVLALTFWWLIRGTWPRGMRATGWGILVVHTVQLLLLSHFMCYYFRGCFTRGPLSGAPFVCAEG